MVPTLRHFCHLPLVTVWCWQHTESGFLLEQKCFICQQNIKNIVWETDKNFSIVMEPSHTEMKIKWLFAGMFFRFSFIIRCVLPLLLGLAWIDANINFLPAVHRSLFETTQATCDCT